MVGIRPDDLFFGAKAGDVQPDWLDINKIGIPQADEQQRLLANLIVTMAADRKPVPRFWYLPRGEKAAVVMTGDDHAFGGTAGRFDQYKTASPAGCSVAAWECVRSTSYIFPNSPLTSVQANSYVSQGFEVAVHVTVGGLDCLDWTRACSRRSSRRNSSSSGRSTRECRPSRRIGFTAWAGQTGRHCRRSSSPTECGWTRTTTTSRAHGSVPAQGS